MIDVNREHLLTLSTAAKRIPGRASGKAIHKSALYRWASRGLDGVRLETIPVGGTLFTSVEALQRFCAARAYARRCHAPRGRSRAAAGAVKELERHGF